MTNLHKHYTVAPEKQECLAGKMDEVLRELFMEGSDVVEQWMRKVLDLRRDIEGVHRGTNQKSRGSVITSTLKSGASSAIRRIPELLKPLRAEEIGEIYKWAEETVRGGLRAETNQDFVAHLMLNCGISTDRIMHLLRRYPRYDTATLDRAETAMRGGSAKFDAFLREIANRLIKDHDYDDDTRARDRGKHILMTIARMSGDWMSLAQLFAVLKLDDLRWGVFERFILECWEHTALTIFCENVIHRSWRLVNESGPEDVENCTPQMHRILSSIERMGWSKGLEQAITLFETFGERTPRSIRERIEPYKKVGAST